MSGADKSQIGTFAWVDLTVGDAENIRKFYSDVVGWDSSPVDMGEYSDFCMNLPGSDNAVAGVCHARGSNAKMPPQWLIYIVVANVDESAERCVELGGKIIDGPREMGKQRFVVIQDPAGAVAGLIGE